MKAMREKKAKRAAIAERNHHSFMNFLESEEIPNFNFRYNKYNKYQGTISTISTRVLGV